MLTFVMGCTLLLTSEDWDGLAELEPLDTAVDTDTDEAA